jgi:cardiolipin synthase
MSVTAGRYSRPRRPRSQPRRFLQRNVPRRWRHRLAPAVPRRRRRRRAWGVPSPWTRIRKTLFTWWLWAGAAFWASVTQDWVNAAWLWAMAAVTRITAPIEHPPQWAIEHETAVGTRAFTESIAGATGSPFFDGNDVTVLNNGDEFYPAMLAAIRQARRSVTIEAYIYWNGEVGRQFAEALADRARNGVQVKILLDAIGSASIGTDILATLESGGCQLAWFHPIHWYTIGRFNQRTHRKTLLVDGSVGFTGGAGIGDQWKGCAQDPEHWHDVQVRVEGPGAVPLQTGFVANWLETTGELVCGEDFFPPASAAGNVQVQTVMSSPVVGSSSVRTLYLLSIVSARKSILIANPYFVPDGAAVEALKEARARGVEVHVMVSGARNDHWLARHNSARLYGRVLEAGVRIYEYETTMLHHKVMVVDGTWATIGTANFDNRSLGLNEESNVSFYDPAPVARLIEIFEQDLPQCTEVTLEAWRARGFLRKVQEGIASLLQDQV